MNESSRIENYVFSLINSPRFQDRIAHHAILPESDPEWGAPERPWPAKIDDVLRDIGIDRLFCHQAEAIDRIRDGRHVVISTSTASGKTLSYNLPVLERILENPQSRALYLFPLKALAQDQLRNFTRFVGRLEEGAISAAIYDGDTSAYRRKKIRENPPNVLLTNPEMLHLSILAYHSKWIEFLRNLETVVVDEVHTYTGVLGSHMALVLRRFQRICAAYEIKPTFVFSSATISNPLELAEQLSGLQVEAVSKNGAGRGIRHVVMMNPEESIARTAILLLKAALARNLRTILYTQSRKMTELIAIWAGESAGSYASRIAAYRAGLMPEERRQIESKLASGELLAVVSTSALELGIDIGDLDLCILAGYPGSIIATWQRSGRVGRSGQDAALVLIAGDDALDQYFMRNPDVFLGMPPEAAVINPENPPIVEKHLECASAELPLEPGEPFTAGEVMQGAIQRLMQGGKLLESEDGERIFARRARPHREVDLRGSGQRYRIVDDESGDLRGEIDGFRVFRETHPGAIYLHGGSSYRVEALDTATRTVRIRETDAGYYTRVTAEKDIEIIDIRRRIDFGPYCCARGALRVTDRVTGYEALQIRSRTLLERFELDLPPLTFETEALWFEIPREVPYPAAGQVPDILGGLHAVEHAVIGIFPLVVLADRNDLGGLATLYHPGINGAVIFIYDGIPGGAGLTRQAFVRAGTLLHHARRAIESCSCVDGCPVCIQSPKCGNRNRPLDKGVALQILSHMQDHIPLEIDRGEPSIRGEGRSAKPERRPDPAAGEDGRGRPSFSESENRRNGNLDRSRENEPIPDENQLSFDSGRLSRSTEKFKAYGVLDIETQRSAKEVGGWHRADRMKISCAVLYDSRSDRFVEYMENQVDQLVAHLKQIPLIVGFNIKRFDYQVLGAYTETDLGTLPTFDILEHVHRRLGFRLSLDHLARETLGKPKTADGLQALAWWKEGRIREILDYCRVDVEITRDLYLFGIDNGYLLFKDRAGNRMRVPADFDVENA